MNDCNVGADPEVFLFDSKQKVFVSAAGFFPGTKKNPHPVEKGAIQVDGVALEFNIDAATTEDEFFSNIKTVYTQMEEMVKNVNSDWEIKLTPIANFETEVWDKVPDDAKVLGCDPDWNIYGNVNPNPSNQLENVGVRTGSGHIHIGWTEDEEPDNPFHFEDCLTVAKRFHSRNIFHPQTNEELARLKYYGMNGSFRPKKYGVELRAPSNTWLKSENSIKEVFRKTKKTFDDFTNSL